MTESALTIIIIVIVFVLAAGFLFLVNSGEQVRKRRDEAEQRERLAAAHEREKTAKQIEARVAIFEQALINQLQKWSRDGIIHRFKHERVSTVKPYEQVSLRSWRIEAAVDLVGNDGNTQAEWRKAVRAFVEKLSAEFSLLLRRTDIVDYRFDLDFEEKEQNDS